MYLNQDVRFGDYGDFTLTLDWYQEEHITKNCLLRAIKQIEVMGDELDIPVYDALNEAITYFLTPDEIEQLTTREINSEWLNLVANQVKA